MTAITGAGDMTGDGRGDLLARDQAGKLWLYPMVGNRLHRFVRSKDNQVIDILVPDHSPPNWKPTTVPACNTIQIAGGNQALQRLQVITVMCWLRNHRSSKSREPTP